VNRLFASLLLLLSSAVSGCAYMERQTALEEQRQLSWTGPGEGPCAFGGVTEAASAHCAMLAWGTEGVLEAVNEKVRGFGVPMLCTSHVAAVESALLRHKELRTTPIYTCPAIARAQGQCHVSLEVTDRDGERYVVDNGAVVSGLVGSGGVASFNEFARAVDGIYWIGSPPSVEDIGHAIPGFKPNSAYDFAFR